MSNREKTYTIILIIVAIVATIYFIWPSSNQESISDPSNEQTIPTDSESVLEDTTEVTCDIETIMPGVIEELENIGMANSNFASDEKIYSAQPNKNQVTFGYISSIGTGTKPVLTIDPALMFSVVTPDGELDTRALIEDKLSTNEIINWSAPFYIRNSTHKLVTLPISTEAKIYIPYVYDTNLPYGEKLCSELISLTANEFIDRLSDKQLYEMKGGRYYSAPIMFTIQNGTITSIVEQYLP